MRDSAWKREFVSFGWRKVGLVYEASKYTIDGWRLNSGITPQPYRLNEHTLRVFSGSRDVSGVSRIGYADFDINDVSAPVRVSETPVLDIGRDGCFDDNGMILGDVRLHQGQLFMFYVGFQNVAKAKFLAFSGLAISSDQGESFQRVSEAPILGRSANQTTIGAIHTAIFEGGVWRIWFARGDGWKFLGGKPYPQYHIRYVETSDLMNIPNSSIECAMPLGKEYRIGRPKVYRLLDGNYMMIATRGDELGNYTPVIFWSEDGVNWLRDDEAFPLKCSSHKAWDSQMFAYPTLINGVDNSTLMFYNGNNMGVDGYGLAISPNTVINND